MFSLSKKNKVFIIPLTGFILAAIFLYSELYRNNGRIGFPLDDTWIHSRFAHNLARNFEFSFNPGEQTPGDSSPLWVVLLAMCSFFTGEFVITAKALSFLLYLLTGYSVNFLCQILTRKTSFSVVTACVALYAGRFAWSALSGMEISLFAATSLLAICFHIQDKRNGEFRFSTATLFGLATLTRSEGYILFFLAVVDRMVQIARPEEKKVFLSLRKVDWKPVVLYLLLALSYPIFCWFTTGNFLPNTFYSKMHGSLYPTKLSYITHYISFLAWDNPLLFLLLPIGFSVLIADTLSPRSPMPGHSQLIIFWLLFYPIVCAFIFPSTYHYMRLMIPLIPGYVVVGMIGLDWCAGYISQVFEGVVIGFGRIRIGFRRVMETMVIMVLIAGTMSFVRYADLFGWNVQNINHLQVRVAQWLRNNTSPDAVVALADIGAIGMIAQNRVIDLNGIVTPELVEYLNRRIKAGRIDYPYQDKLLLQYLGKKKPEYLVIFPRYYPRLSRNKTVFKEVFQARLARNTICYGNLMVVFQCDWSKYYPQ